MMNILYPALIFIVVTGAMMAVLLPIVSNQSKRRLGTIIEDIGYAANKQHADWAAKAVKLVSPFAKLSLPTEGWEQSPLRARFMHAGYRGDAPIAIYFGAKTILALLLPGMVYLYLLLRGVNVSGNTQLLFLLSAAALGYYAA